MIERLDIGRIDVDNFSAALLRLLQRRGSAGAGWGGGGSRRAGGGSRRVGGAATAGAMGDSDEDGSYSDDDSERGMVGPDGMPLTDKQLRSLRR